MVVNTFTPLASAVVNIPANGARITSKDIRVEYGKAAKFEVAYDVDATFKGIKAAGGDIAVAPTIVGIENGQEANVTTTDGIMGGAPIAASTGSGRMALYGPTKQLNSASVFFTFPKVTKTVTPEIKSIDNVIVAYTDRFGGTSKQIRSSEVAIEKGSIIVQYPVTVTIDGQKPAGASVGVNTTVYDTDKKTYAPTGTATELNTDDKFWVDSDTSNNNPVLKITTPEGYTAEVTVNGGNPTKSSGNVSLGAVAKDTTVKVKFVQGQDTNVYVTYNANGGVGTDKRVAVNGTHQVQENTFTRANYVFSRWTNDEAGKDIIYKVGESKQIDASLTLYAQWFKQHADGSIEVPGKDMGFGGDKDKDNVTVKPGADNKKPTVNRDGNVVVPDDSTGKVNVPDKTNPDKKTEVEVPGGTTVKPDGTITLPDGTVLDPANPNVTAGYVVTYEANNGTDSKRIVYVKNGEQHTVADNSFTYKGHVFSSWRDAATITDTDKFGTMVKAGDPLSATKTLKALWFKQDADRKITVPGVDGDLTKTEDNVSVKTNDSTKQPTINPDNGNAKVPTGTTGRIDRKDPANNGKTETIIVPEGTEVKPDGTIVFPGGKEVGPNEQITDDKLPAGWITVTYNSNNANSQTAKQVGASPVKAENNMFTPEQGMAFEGWYENKNFSGNKIAPKAEISTSKTLYARWKTAGTGDFKYNGKIEFHSNLDTDTTYEQIVSSADSASIAATLETPFNTDKPTGWELLGWSTVKNGAASGNWYAAGASVTVANNATLILYAIWHKTDNNNIVLPGVDGNTGTTDATKAEDNVTVKKDNGAAPSPKKDKGYVEAVTGNKINLPKADKTKDVTVVTGPVNVYPDGTVVVPERSKVTMPDGSEKDGPVVINPDGKTDDNNVVKKDEATGDITLAGPDGKLDNDDDVVVKGQPDNTPSGEIKSSNEVVVRKPTNVEIPGDSADQGKSKVEVPVDTVVKPNGTIVLPDNAGATITKPDKTSVDVPGGSEIDAWGNITYKYWVEYKNGNKDIRAKVSYMVKNGATREVVAPSINGYVVDGKDTATITGGEKPYTIIFNYKKASETKVEYATVIRYTDSVEGTKISTVTSKSNPIVGKLEKNTFTRENWSFLGWNTKADGNGTFYPDQNKFVLYDNEELQLFTIWYKKDNQGNIIVPGVDAMTDTNDDVTVKPNPDNADVLPEPDGKGNIKVPEGGSVKRPDSEEPIQLPGGGLVKPDGTIIKPDGSVIKPGTTDTTDPEKPNETKRDEQGNIVLPGVDKVLGTGDDVKVAPKTDANGKDNSIIDKDNDGRVLLPDGGTVERPIDPQNPSKGTEKIEVPEGTIVLPDGTIIYPGNVIQKPDNTIVVPGKDNKTETDDVVLKPDNNGNSAGTVDKNGDTTVKPGGGTVSIPGKNPPDTKTDIQVPAGTVIKPDGTIIKPDGTTIYPDGSNNGNNNNGGNSGNHGSSSGGSSTTTYTIKATAGNGGSISPKGNVSVVRSSDKLFNFTADAGYEVASVLVDGKDIGKVSSYNFTNVRASHTIEVKFKKIGAVEPKPNTVADPKETGVAGKLETDKHDAYMKGYANGTFGSNANMTRAEAAQMFYNLLLNKQTVADAGFTDVAADRWYADAVNTLAFMGIINGVGNNQFAPSRTISRAEFAAIATRFAKANSNGSLAFTDVKRSDWFYNSVLTAVNYGWIGGYSNGTFKPNNNITRAEVVSIVNKMLARSADKTFINSNASSIKSFTDVSKSFWGFYEVTEATNGHDHVKNDGVESWQ